MIIADALCTDCIQVISNPICPRCFSKEVNLWIKDRKIPYYKKRVIEKHIARLVNKMEDSPSDIKCILCNSGRVNLCIYCLTISTSRIIEKNAPQKVMQNFNKDFNTDIWNI